MGRRLVPGLPWDPPRPSARAPRPVRWKGPLPPAAAKLLRDDAGIAGTAVPRALAACVAELLRRHDGEREVALLARGEGAAVTPLLLEADGALTPKAAAQRVRDAESAAAALPPATLESLRAASGLPAEDCFAVQLAAGRAAAPLDGARVVITFVGIGSTRAIAIVADGRWLPARAVADLGRRLVALLASAARAPRKALASHDLVTREEASRLAGAWAGRRVRYPERASLSALLRAVAARTPDAVAVDDVARRLTYAELLAQAVRVRRRLVEEGVRPGARVGVLVERSAEQVVALAGVLEAGCVAVPLDAAQPALRAQRMAELASLAAIVTVEAQRAVAEAVAAPRATRVMVLPSLDAPAAPAEPPLPVALEGGARAAYVLFTSGSTGEPKGVECPHRAVVRLVRHGLTRIAAKDRVLGNAPFTFDVALFETWGALLAGATLVLAPAGLSSLAALAALIEGRALTVACMTPGILREMAQFHLDRLASLRLLLVAGEAMPPREAVAVARRFPRLAVVNGYGPTENNYTTMHRVRGGDADDRPVPIGRPLDNTTVYVVDDAMRLVPPGMVGELCTGGDGLAIGYLGRKALTDERFVTLRLPGGRRERVYRTGDLARHRADGVLEFLGRADAQVKVRGFRVELEEVERTLAQAPGVAMAAVAVVGEGAARRLRAVVVPAKARGARGRAAAAPAALLAAARGFVEERLPAYMVPSELLVVERIPLTAHEKVDRRAIAAMPGDAALAARGTAPAGAGERAGTSARASGDARAGEFERALTAIWAELLGTDAFDREAGFFEVGGTSLLALRLAEEIRVRLAVELPITRVFEFPTVASLAAHLAESERGGSRGASTAAPSSLAPARGGRADAHRGDGRADHRIAIVGMAGRFPGADSPDALWTLLREEREGIRFFARDEIAPGIADRMAPHYSPARGVLDGVEDFDPEFFGISPRLAEITDPQQRLLLEAAWNAFEDAGIVPGDGDALTGVFTGVSHNGYVERNLASHPDLLEAVGDAAVLFANDKDYSATHIAHRLDLRGPAVAVQTSSSTSLAAIAMAVQALRSGQCDRALAGGAAVTVPVNSGHAHVEGGMFSRDGHTRTFDADATGTVFSDGVAMVLLQRLADAEREGRPILGVIHGVGITNDGGARASFSAPTVAGQEQCIARAFADAGWSADSVSCLEAHGTGTPLGDPIEVEALTRAFARTTARRRFCWIGSVKSNIGHLTAAAGAASVIKVLLAMRHRWIPGTLHVERPNPRIDFEHSPFLVARQGLAWESEGAPRRAGVSSFGVGGTNIHLLIEEYARREEPASDAEVPRAFVLSARTPTALRARARALAEALGGAAPAHEAARPREALPLDAVVATLRDGRRAFERRAVVVASTRADAVARLRALAASTDEPARTVPRDVVLLFPGQGTQSAGAGKALHATNASFRAAIDRCVAAAGRIQGKRLSTWLFAGESEVAGIAERIRATDIAQPVLFALEYALGRTVLDAGLRPAAMVGHSIGEFAAAALAGVMSPEDAMRAVVERGRLMAAMAPGAMLAVRLPADEVRPRLPADVVVAAINAPRLCVVSGPEEAIARTEAALTADGVGCRRLLTSHAFHSPSMDEAAARFEAFMRRVPLRAPERPFVSCVSGAPITAAEATDPAYWGRQLRQPVRFADGIAQVAGDRPVLFVECGPRETLSALAAQVVPGRAVSAALLPVRDGEDEATAFLEAVGTLWQHGPDPLTWGVLDRHLHTAPVNLPGYPFDRRRLWVEEAHGTVARGGPGARDLRGLLQDQLQLIQDQLSVLRSAAAASNGREAAE